MHKKQSEHMRKPPESKRSTSSARIAQLLLRQGEIEGVRAELEKKIDSEDENECEDNDQDEEKSDEQRRRPGYSKEREVENPPC